MLKLQAVMDHFCESNWPLLAPLALCPLPCGVQAGERTEALSMELLTQRDPDIIVIACRGLSMREALETLVGLPDLAGWDSLTAVRTGRVYIVDGSR